MIFVSLAHANECMYLHNERNFPQAKLNNKVLAGLICFLLKEYGGLYFLLHIIIVYNILSSLIKKTSKHFIGRKKNIYIAGSMYIPVLWDANYDRENNDYTN